VAFQQRPLYPQSLKKKVFKMTKLNTSAPVELTAEQKAAATKEKKKARSIAKADLTQEKAKEFLRVGNPEAGESADDLYWCKDTVAAREGDFAGGRRAADNYYSVVFAGTNYSGKQMIAFINTGVWPERITNGVTGGGKPAKEVKPREVRVPKVFTPEEIAAAKAKKKEVEDKRKAAAKEKKEKEAAAAPVNPASLDEAVDTTGELDLSNDTSDIDGDDSTL
jgi:hypothetical protein